MTNFAQELAAAVADDPERPAVKLDDLVLNYALLDAGDSAYAPACQV